jgi:hypothetical protein
VRRDATTSGLRAGVRRTEGEQLLARVVGEASHRESWNSMRRDKAWVERLTGDGPDGICCVRHG